MKKSSKKWNKKKISEIINKIIPIFIPINTFLEWNPCRVLSREISRHHWYIIIKIVKNEIKYNIRYFWLNILIVLVNNIIVDKDPIRGHGL